MAQPVVLGIDPSERGCGLVAVPANWRRSFDRVRSVTLELGTTPKAPPAEKLAALRRMAIDAVIFAAASRVTHVWIERPPTHQAFNMPKVLEVAHVIRHELFRELGLVSLWCEQSSARKLLLGKLPQSDRKVITRTTVESLHRFEDGDQCDAYVVANWGLSELGLPAFCGAEVAA